MKISTLVIVRIVNSETLTQIGEAQGPAAGFIIPRVGEFIEISVNSEDKLFEVVRIGHKYTEVYRNCITLYVKPGEIA